ncbi:hypothetical protein GOBAR_DD07652 [Gossypium barbadense]|nr:hypothetical protein GOBAR_DD07652 [Gossypium barbadense]
MKAVSFMYIRPPGYNAESAKAAEITDERKKTDHNNVSDDHSTDVPSTEMQQESLPGGGATTKEKRKSRPKDVFGRSLPTEEELETGVPGKVKPFAVEVHNVKYLRYENYGHQSGDRHCPLKDAIIPNEESRLKRDDPLTAIMAQMDPTEVGSLGVPNIKIPKLCFGKFVQGKDQCDIFMARDKSLLDVLYSLHSEVDLRQ